MKKISLLLIAFFTVMVSFVSCQKDQVLQQRLEAYVETCPAQIGVAVILPDSNVIVVNDGQYAMNSVLKLFQDLPSALALDKRNVRMHDSLWIHPYELNQNTYSPMLQTLTESYMPVAWGDIFEYAVSKSDNNASDLLFGYATPIDSIVEFWNAKGIEDFNIQWRETQLNQDPQRSDDNWTTPLAAAKVINYTAPMSLISSNYNLALAGGVLMKCQTGENRISKPLKATDAIVLHKTGTGMNDSEGNPTGINDVAYIMLPSGQTYTLAVFVKESQVDLAQTEEMIANISQIVLEYVMAKTDKDAKK